MISWPNAKTAVTRDSEFMKLKIYAQNRWSNSVIHQTILSRIFFHKYRRHMNEKFFMYDVQPKALTYEP